MKNLKSGGLFLVAMGAIVLFPEIGLCSVESTLTAIQTKLVGTILPLAAVLGLVWAGLSFVAGHPNAKSHLMLAMVGAGVGFGAQSLVSLIRGLVH